MCHLAIIIRAGSRDEEEQKQGLAHFVEHCLFKGTAHRKTYHILSRLDDIGGELNAFTGKEDTTLYATVLDPYFRRAAELLVDIAFHSTFPEREISKEKDVVVDEIHAYADSPSDHIFDLFDELIFPDHPLGRNILGTPKSVRSFSRGQLLEFTARLYRTGRIVLATAGPMSGEKVERIWSALWATACLKEALLEEMVQERTRPFMPKERQLSHRPIAYWVIVHLEAKRTILWPFICSTIFWVAPQ